MVCVFFPQIKNLWKSRAFLRFSMDTKQVFCFLIWPKSTSRTHITHWLITLSRVLYCIGLNKNMMALSAPGGDSPQRKPPLDVDQSTSSNTEAKPAMTHTVNTAKTTLCHSSTVEQRDLAYQVKCRLGPLAGTYSAIHSRAE